MNTGDNNSVSKSELLQQKKEEISRKRKAKFSVLNNQTKLIKKLLIREHKTKRRVAQDVEVIKEILKNLKNGETVKILSNNFDSPSIIHSMDFNNLKKVYISTWAITESGILAIKKLSDSDIPVNVLLDTTHSYKWIFSSGAYNLLNKLVDFKFTENHSKFQLFEFKDGRVISIVGSMNISNNPRWENLEISTSRRNFEFYKTWMDAIFEKKLDKQIQMFSYDD